MDSHVIIKPGDVSPERTRFARLARSLQILAKKKIKTLTLLVFFLFFHKNYYIVKKINRLSFVYVNSDRLLDVYVISCSHECKITK